MNIAFDNFISSRELMEKDFRLLAEGGRASLRFYSWPNPSCSWGVFVRPSELVHDEVLEHLSSIGAQRPTGGGLLFHGTDLSLSLFLPSGHPSLDKDVEAMYRLVHQYVLMGIMPFLKRDVPEVSCAHETPAVTHFCQAQATGYDLHFAGKKIAGCAQRRTKQGMLFQMSLFLKEPQWDFIKRVVKDKEAVASMRRTVASIESFSSRSIDESAVIFALSRVFSPVLIPNE